MQHLSQLSEELLEDPQTWGFSLCSRSNRPECGILLSNSQFVQVVKPTWKEKTSKVTILAASDTSLKKNPANAQLARISKLTRRRKSHFCKILIFFFWILQLWFLSTEKTIWPKWFFKERNQNVCPQCSSIAISAQWCFARSQLSYMWSYNISYLHSCLYLSVLMCTVERACYLSAPARCVRAYSSSGWCTLSHATVWHDTPSHAKCRVMLCWVMCHESAASGGTPWRSASLPNLGCPHHNNLSSIFVDGAGRCEGSRQRDQGQSPGSEALHISYM